MKLNDLHAPIGANKSPWRKGRGHATGNGKTAGKGHKGQKARAGGGVRPGFEGGQMPLYMRLPKRGFNNKNFATVYAEINLDKLNIFEDGTEVTPELLVEKNIIKKTLDGVKVLGTGELTKKITVKASKFSKSAQEKIEAAGGKVQVI